MSRAGYAVVIPTIGRPELLRCLESLAAAAGPLPDEIVVVDDRAASARTAPLAATPAALADRTRVLPGQARGPAAARNVGWRATRSAWLVFVDDDVVLSPSWRADLADDLDVPAEVAGVQARIEVPLPRDRRPTDWERSTSGLATARWITADMAYRRSVLADLGGFDERFPRAYREDADLALRVHQAGHRLVVGTRWTTHPVRPSDRWASVRQQAGNADDPLMARLHGRRWRALAEAPPGRRHRHALVTAAGASAVLAAVALGVRRQARPVTAAWALASGATWLVGTAELALARIRPGPRTPDELSRMVLTSIAIPPAATVAWLRGRWRHRNAQPWPGPPAAVLFDRDGTLVHDVPYNGDPSAVRPTSTAAPALERLRAAGVRVGVVTNQSGIARGILTRDQVDQVNARVDELLGPFEAWAICPHAPEDGCRCRKPSPGLLEEVAGRLNLPLERCALIGDIGSDIEAARAAGIRGVLVPNGATRPEEVAAIQWVAPDLEAAVDLLLTGPGRRSNHRAADLTAGAAQ